MYFYTENLEMINSFEVILDKTKHAVAYSRKVLELKKRGLSKEDIETIMQQPIQMEMYYDADTDSIYAVETEAVTNTTIFNPYSSVPLVDSAKDNGMLKKGAMIEEINAICSTYGSVEFGLLQLDSHPVYGEGETTISFVEGLDMDSLTWVQYDKSTNEEIDSQKVLITKDTHFNIVDELHNIAHSWFDFKFNE